MKSEHSRLTGGSDGSLRKPLKLASLSIANFAPPPPRQSRQRPIVREPAGFFPRSRTTPVATRNVAPGNRAIIPRLLIRSKNACRCSKRPQYDSTFRARNPLEPGFNEERRGKRVYFAARRETGAAGDRRGG
jgi:hypothetical protein